ncbi:hypothetical protein BC834DRAFT_850692 [Gloeopeniophorella convolvens]|nr:hypothetical protein BC834DRAFT_850692 [Gloeopeniophorella convolvens]
MAVFTPVHSRVYPTSNARFHRNNLLFSLFYFYLQWQSETRYPVPYLTLVPGSSLFYPWTFFTSVFVETSVLRYVSTAPARLWGGAETIKFIVATVTVSNIIAFVVNWIEYVLFRNADLFLYGMEYHGQMALQVGLLHQVQLFGVIRAGSPLIAVQTLPMAYVTLSTCPFIVIQFGWLVSWWRTTYGDRSETFALVNSFPPFMHTPITFLGNTVYIYASRFHLIPGAGADIEANHSQPGSARAEAERRRAMALKALDQRLAKPGNARCPGAEAAKAPEENEEGDLGASSKASR